MEKTNKLHYAKQALLAVIILTTAASCDNADNGKKTLVKSKGLPSELLVVVDRDVWKTDLRDTIENIVEAQVTGLMQAEKMFRITRIFSDNYERTYTTMHSKLFVHVDPSIKKTIMGINRDVTARPQIEVTITSPTPDQLRDYLHRNSQQIQDIIADAQIDMRVAQLRKKYSKRVSDDLHKTLGMTIRVPENLTATKRGKDFLWGGTNLNQKDLNIVIYRYGWDGSNEFDLTRYVSKRDSVMKINIPGERADQWMETTREKDQPLAFGRTRHIDGKQVYEVRGLWQVRNAALGGPFVSLVRIDSTTHQVIAAEGFVYSPSTDKRDLLRQMEAALRTLEKTKTK